MRPVAVPPIRRYVSVVSKQGFAKRVVPVTWVRSAFGLLDCFERRERPAEIRPYEQGGGTVSCQGSLVAPFGELEGLVRSVPLNGSLRFRQSHQ